MLLFGYFLTGKHHIIYIFLCLCTFPPILYSLTDFLPDIHCLSNHISSFLSISRHIPIIFIIPLGYGSCRELNTDEISHDNTVIILQSEHLLNDTSPNYIILLYYQNLPLLLRSFSSFIPFFKFIS